MPVEAGSLADVRLDVRQRAVLLGALAGATLLAWLYLLMLAARMDMPVSSMGQGAMRMAPMPWTAAQYLLTVLMWAVMMVAMMLPSAAPMVMSHAAVARRIAPGSRPLSSSAAFVGGYVLVWSAFSVGAALLQWMLERAALLSPAMVSSSHLLGGALLVIAGLYQWSPLKGRCLRLCQSPLTFLGMHWRPGPAGALRMGLRHGAYCVGCCWAVMLLLFVGGVMNLLWVAAIAVFVLLEKLLAGQEPLGRRISGGGLVLAGLGLLTLGMPQG